MRITIKIRGLVHSVEGMRHVYKCKVTGMLSLNTTSRRVIFVGECRFILSCLQFRKRIPDVESKNRTIFIVCHESGQ
jgi:hypothetical protein